MTVLSSILVLITSYTISCCFNRVISRAYYIWNFDLPFTDSSFWVKPSMIGEYRDRVDVDPASGSFPFYIRACVGARVSMFFDNSEDVTYEIVFGNKTNDNPVVCKWKPFMFRGVLVHHLVHGYWHIEAETKWPPFSRRHFQMRFTEWECVIFYQDFTEVCSQGSNWQYSSIGSDNGLAPTRRQAIIWTNTGFFTGAYMRHSASVS